MGVVVAQLHYFFPGQLQFEYILAVCFIAPVGEFRAFPPELPPAKMLLLSRTHTFYSRRKRLFIEMSLDQHCLEKL